MNQHSTGWTRALPIILLMYIGCITFGAGSISYAAEQLPPGLVIGDDSGIYATSEGEFYVDLPSVLPGDVYEKEITIRSLDIQEPFSLGLLVEPAEATGIIDFNEYIWLTLTLDGQELYDGPLLGDGSFDWTQTPLELGVCSYGTDKILQARFQVSAALTEAEYREESQLLFHWIFVAVRDYAASTESSSQISTDTVSSSTSSSYQKPSGGHLPQTGEDLRDMLYKLLIGLLLITIVLLLWKKRNDK